MTNERDLIVGGQVLLQSMGLGIKALNYSASEAFAEAQEAESTEVEVALTPAVIEGEGDFAGLTGAVPGLFPVPTQKRAKDEMKKGGTPAAAGSIIFAVIFNVLLFVAAPLLLTNALFIGAGWAPLPSSVAVATSQQPNGAGTVSNVNNGSNADNLSSTSSDAWYLLGWRTVKTYLHPVRPSVAFNLIDGLIRMTFFLI